MDNLTDRINILYEDEYILAIDKPSGLAVHPTLEQSQHETSLDAKNKIQTISEWFAKKYPQSVGVGEPLGEIQRSGIVHRLDRETSGVLLLAKSAIAHELLKNQFINREIEKTYIAVVTGHIKNDEGMIDKDIGRSPTDFRRRLAGRGARGELRKALTEYKVLKRFELDGEKFSLVELSPKTGRTHQIRVHMKYLSYPVACDTLYAPKNICPTQFGRMMLHAKAIEFHNISGDKVRVESPLPEQFAQIEKF